MNLCRFVVLCDSIACVRIATMLRGLKRHDIVLKAYIYIIIAVCSMEVLFIYCG